MNGTIRRFQMPHAWLVQCFSRWTVSDRQTAGKDGMTSNQVISSMKERKRTDTSEWRFVFRASAVYDML